MHVLFDIEPVLSYPGGIPIYAAELVRALAVLPEAPVLHGAYATARYPLCRLLRRRVAELQLTIPVSWIPLPGRLAGTVKTLAWNIARPRLPQVDLIHVTSCLPPAWLPFGQRNSVLSVYDLGFVRYPEERYGSPNVSARTRQFGDVLRAADHLITISEFTKREIKTLFGIADSKISVIYLAPQWSAQSQSAMRHPERDILGKHGLEEQQYFLAVGTISPRKNYPVLIEGFRRFAAAGYGRRLVIVGNVGWAEEELISELERGIPGVVWIRHASADELSCLYRSATASCLISKYEGFGIPVLEAMVHGCPVIHATGSSLDEVAGNAGIAVDPNDSEAVSAALQKVAADAALREHLRTLGLKRASAFSWKRVAEETHAVYKQVGRVSDRSGKRS